LIDFSIYFKYFYCVFRSKYDSLINNAKGYTSTRWSEGYNFLSMTRKRDKLWFVLRKKTNTGNILSLMDER